MIDIFEKKINKHYTYICKKEPSFSFNGGNDWYISRQEHEANEKPDCGGSFRAIAFGLSEGSARAEVIELQLAEMNRRQNKAQCFSVV